MRLRTLLLAAPLLLAPGCSLAAQDGDTTSAGLRITRSRPGWSVSRTMRELLREMEISPIGFFSTRGEWDFVTRTRHPDGSETVGVHRFPGAQTLEAVERPDGPLCNVFHSGDAVALPSLAAYAYYDNAWRRTGPARFDLYDPNIGGGMWVEWRREGRRWVISSIGERMQHFPAVLGIPVAEARDTMRGRRLALPLPPTARLATDAPWYASSRMLPLGDRPYMREHEPRTIASGRLAYYATTADGVMVWAERRALASRWGPEVVYVPIDRAGTFMPYDLWQGNGCH